MPFNTKLEQSYAKKGENFGFLEHQIALIGALTSLFNFVCFDMVFLDYLRYIDHWTTFDLTK